MTSEYQDDAPGMGPGAPEGIAVEPTRIPLIDSGELALIVRAAG